MCFCDLDVELCLKQHQQESLWSVTAVTRTGSWPWLQRSSDEFLERPNPSQPLSLPSSCISVQFSTLVFNSLCAQTHWRLPSHLIRQTKSNHWDQAHTNTHSSQESKVEVCRPGRFLHSLPIYTFMKYASNFLLSVHSIPDKSNIRRDFNMQIPHRIFTSLSRLFALTRSTADDNTQYMVCRPLTCTWIQTHTYSKQIRENALG